LITHRCSHLDKLSHVYISDVVNNYITTESLIHQKLQICKITRKFFNIELTQHIKIIQKIIELVNNPIDLRTNNINNINNDIISCY
jgi:hypothetical protein